MIVGFDFESAGPTVADVDDAGVFARPLNHQLASRREPFEMSTRRFVGTMLAPHHAEDAQLRERRLVAQRALNSRVLVRRDAVVGTDFRSNRGSMRGNWRIALLLH